MLVSKKTFLSVLENFTSLNLAMDTETNSLLPYAKTSRLFSIIIATESEEFYFNFNPYPDFDVDFVLPFEVIPKIAEAINQTPKTLFAHNFKYDLAFLAKEGFFLDAQHTLHDSEVIARLIRSDYESYELDACAKRIGLEKDDAVMKYLNEKKLYEFVSLPGKKKRQKNYFFAKVPPEIIIPYGRTDSRVTFALGMHQLAEIKTDKEKILYANETALTRVCFEMEQAGIKIDKAYCEKAKEFELLRCAEHAAKFKEITGLEFKDSRKVFSEAFGKLGFTAPKTEKNNDSFTDKVLEDIDHPLAQVIRDWRSANKWYGTYYSNFTHLADENDVLHANIRQSKAVTGRFSMSEPNLQNIPKNEEDGSGDEAARIRRAFIPREGFVFYEFDYKAQEFRLTLEYAEEADLCKQIIAGLDPHDATAKLVGILRKKAKTLNFALIYGMGLAKLAKALGVSIEEARTFKRQYFAALPRVAYFIRQATLVAEQRGYVHNWAGKKYYFPDAKFAYKAANAIVQGGCAEIMKFAMVKIRDYLRDKKSKMLVQIHDAALLEVHKDEEHFVPKEVATIMRTVYPAKFMPMDVSTHRSENSWAEMKEVG